MVIGLVRGLGITGILLALAASSVFAQPSTPLPPAAEQALRRGVVATQQESWPLAIRYFTEAQQLSPGHPSVLFNLGLAHAKAGHELLGAVWLRSYLAVAPTAPNAANVRQEIDRLEVAIEVKAEQVVAEALSAVGKAEAEGTSWALRYAEIARAQMMLGDLVGARRTSELALQFANKEVNPDRRNEKLSEAALAEVTVGNLFPAEQIAEQITDLDKKAGALLAVVRAEVSAQGWHGALRTVAKIAEPCSKGEALLAIAKVQPGPDAKRTLAEAREVAGKIGDNCPGLGDGLRQRTYLLRAIADAQAAFGDFLEARQTAREIPDPNDKNWALDAIVEKQLKVGDLGGARQTAEDLVDPQTKDWALSRIARAYARQRDFAGARATAGQIRDSSRRTSALAGLGQAQAEAGNFGAAKQTLTEITDPNSRASLLFSIAVHEAKAGQLAAAQQTAGEIADPTYKLVALLAIGDAQADSGDMAAARQTVTAARQIVGQIGRAAYLSRLSEILAKAHDLAGARQGLAEARQLAEQVRDPFSKNSDLQSIAVAQMRLGAFTEARETLNRAREIAEQIKDPWLRRSALRITEALRELAASEGRVGEIWERVQKVSQAIRSATKIEQEISRKWTELADSYAKRPFTDLDAEIAELKRVWGKGVEDHLAKDLAETALRLLEAVRKNRDVDRESVELKEAEHRGIEGQASR